MITRRTGDPMGKVPEVELPSFHAHGKLWMPVQLLTGDGTGMWVFAVEHGLVNQMPVHLVWMPKHPPPAPPPTTPPAEDTDHA